MNEHAPMDYIMASAMRLALADINGFAPQRRAQIGVLDQKNHLGTFL